jgi:hypothetical protein
MTLTQSIEFRRGFLKGYWEAAKKAMRDRGLTPEQFGEGMWVLADILAHLS